MVSESARSIEVNEAQAMRALAHPVRLQLLGLLRRRGPLTATEAGAILGETPTTCSFHFRQLARYGLVEEAGGGKGRSRPWRATARFTDWSDSRADPAVAAASDLLAGVIADRYFAMVAEWVERRRDESDEWRQSAQFSDTITYLTAAELKSLGGQIVELLRPYEYRLDDPSSRPEGAREVYSINLAFPVDEASA